MAIAMEKDAGKITGVEGTITDFTERESGSNSFVDTELADVLVSMEGVDEPESYENYTLSQINRKGNFGWNLFRDQMLIVSECENALDLVGKRLSFDINYRESNGKTYDNPVPKVLVA